MKIQSILNEALPLDIAKEYRSEWNPNTNKELFAKFNAKYRIYIPFEANKDDVKAPVDIEAYLAGGGYKIIDYVKGYATDANGKQMFKIGKLLKDDPELLKLFQTDWQRGAKRDTKFLAVISRHPYDIAGMSTERNWRSCMELYDGENAHYVMQDVKGGTIIAYAVRENDRNINNPLGRILIKPFANVTNSKDIIYIPEDKVYGDKISGFREVIDEWLSKINGDRTSGLYCKSGKLYNDSEDIDGRFHLGPNTKFSAEREQKAVIRHFTGISVKMQVEVIKKFENASPEVYALAFAASAYPKVLIQKLSNIYNTEFFSDNSILEVIAKNARTVAPFNVIFQDDSVLELTPERALIFLKVNFYNYFYSVNIDSRVKMVEFARTNKTFRTFVRSKVDV